MFYLLCLKCSRLNDALNQKLNVLSKMTFYELILINQVLVVKH